MPHGVIKGFVAYGCNTSGFIAPFFGTTMIAGARIAAGDTAAVEVVTHGTVGSIVPGAALQSRDANNPAFGSMVNSTLVVGEFPGATGFIAPASSDGWTTTGVSFYGFVSGSIGICDHCTFPYQETQGVFVTHSSRTTLAEGSRYV